MRRRFGVMRKSPHGSGSHIQRLIAAVFLVWMAAFPLRAADIVAIAAGDLHTVAVTKDGDVWAWGGGFSPKPSKVEGLQQIVAVAAGQSHTLALGKGGKVWQVRNKKPEPVTLNSAVTAIAAGRSHSLILTGNSTVWSWGSNVRGQLGTGNTNDVSSAVQVDGLADIIAISAGDNRSYALRKDGTVWGWGANSDGSLGDGSFQHRLSPVQIPGLKDVTAIAAGSYHTLALLKDGTVRAWGNNWSETWQLADGMTLDSLTPVIVTGLTNLPAEGLPVIPVKEPHRPLKDIAVIAAGVSHSLAINRSGVVFGWGSNHYWAQLGIGEASWSPNPVQPHGMTDCIAVAAGRYHSVALKKDGSVWTWGGNTHGQLGWGAPDTEPHATPTRVTALDAAR